MSELQTEHQIGIGSVGGAVGLSAFGNELGEIRLCLVIQKKLTRIRPTIIGDGTRFPPNEFGSTGSKASIATEGQLSRSTVQFPVTPFHRLDTPAIANHATANRDGLKE
jgi:hypothetical protein